VRCHCWQQQQPEKEKVWHAPCANGCGFYLEDNEVLPVNLYGHNSQSLLEDEDIMNEVHLHIQSLDKKTQGI